MTVKDGVAARTQRRTHFLSSLMSSAIRSKAAWSEESALARRRHCHLSNLLKTRLPMSNSPLLFLGIEASANKCAVGIVRSDGSILSNPRKTCALCSLCPVTLQPHSSHSWPLPPGTSRHQALVSCPARRRRTTSKSSWASFSKLSRRRPCSRTSWTVYATPKARAWAGHS